MTAGSDNRSPRETLSAQAVSTRLNLYGPTDRDISRVVDKIQRVIGTDNDQFDRDQEKRNEDPEKKVTTLLRKSFPQGTLLKRVTTESIAATRLTTTVDYGIEGEDDQVERLARVRSLAMLCFQRSHVRDIRCRSMMLTQFRGSLGGKAFHDLIQQQPLDVPILVRTDVHQYPGGFLREMDALLGNLALVAELDSAAAAQLTDLVGKDMSCFSGSVRVYHPGWSANDDPREHAIWRQREILREGWDAGFVEHALRDKIFCEMFMRPRERDQKKLSEKEKKIKALEARSNKAETARDARTNELMQAKTRAKEDRRRAAAHIRAERQKRDARTDELTRAKIKVKEDRRRAAAHIKEERQKRVDLKRKMDRLKDETREKIDRLKEERKTLRRARPGIVGGTVQEVVELATSMFGDKELVFGKRVPEGVKKLNPDAGPPEKVLHYLFHLSEFAREMRMGGGSVGKSMVDWFRDRDCEVSPESGTTQEMHPRKFPVNGRKHEFDWHMKPNNLPGAKGGRIYFKWDPSSRKVLVGWIGPHQPTRTRGT